MLRSDEDENDVFFDSSDCLLVEEPVLAEEELESRKLEYEIWTNEPRSVKERRERFLRDMDLVELGDSSRKEDLERITDCSGAVLDSSVSSINNGEGSFTCCEREMNSQTSCMLVDESNQEQNKDLGSKKKMFSPTNGCEANGAQAHLNECENAKVSRKKFKKWWKNFVSMRKGGESRHASKLSNPGVEVPDKTNRMMVHPNKKGYMEFTSLYMGQEIQAHKGFIWTMKFSRDGHYLASGGEDGVVRVWRVTSTDASGKPFMAGGNLSRKIVKEKAGFGGKKPIHTLVVIPDKVFQIEESPIHEFHGHTGDVLDLAWSGTNFLVSSSMDKTVRLWQVGCDECLNVYHHNNYVTCVQFNPMDDNYFISGSIDGKARIWGVSKKRVVDWVDVRDIITAICYRPDGKEFVVGSITGSCHFYNASGNDLHLEAEIHNHGRKRTSGNKITSIQFSQDEPRKVMITSEDSKLRIFDGVDIVHKFKGLSKSGSQMSASFTSSGKHIISVGEDSHVYVWNYDSCLQTSKQTKSLRSCEHFLCEDISVAIPYLGQTADQIQMQLGINDSSRTQSAIASQVEGSSQRFSTGKWFSIVGSCKDSATWPEEKLPLWDAAAAAAAVVEDECYLNNHNHSSADYRTIISETWGQVIVTGGWNGTIKTFHNYGFPVRL